MYNIPHAFYREEIIIDYFMNYLRFMGWLAFMAWALCGVVPRYILPQLEHVYDILDDLSEGSFCEKSLGRPLSISIQVVLSLFLAYVLTIWPVWCVLRYFEFTRPLETGRALYGISGFLLCEYPLGEMANSYKYRGFFTSVFHYTMAMGAYVVFIINPIPIMDYYPWLMRLVGFSF